MDLLGKSLKLIDEAIEFQKKIRNESDNKNEKLQINKFIALQLQKKNDILKKLKDENKIQKIQKRIETKKKKEELKKLGKLKHFNKVSNSYSRNIIKKFSRSDIKEMGHKNKIEFKKNINYNFQIYDKMKNLKGNVVKYHIYIVYRISSVLGEWSKVLFINERFKGDMEFIRDIAISVFRREYVNHAQIMSLDIKELNGSSKNKKNKYK